MEQKKTQQDLRELVQFIVIMALPLIIYTMMIFVNADKNHLFAREAVVKAHNRSKMALLEENMHTWQSLSWREKETAVQDVITYLELTKNSVIKYSPPHYVKQLDEILPVDPVMRDQSIVNVVTYLAIVEYDFFNGQDKDKLALELLGEQKFVANKQRIMKRQKYLLSGAKW